MILPWLWLGCAAPPEPTAPAPGHFGTYTELVAAAEAADLPRAREAARDLLASADTMNDPAVDALGGAVGFLQVADAEELADAVGQVTRACRGCHEAEGVPTPRRPGGARGGAAWERLWGPKAP